MVVAFAFAFVAVDVAALGVGVTLVALFVIASFVPSISVTVRRPHDIGWSGRCCLLAVIPFLSLFLLAVMARAGETGVNEYGPDPIAPVVA